MPSCSAWNVPKGLRELAKGEKKERRKENNLPFGSKSLLPLKPSPFLCTCGWNRPVFWLTGGQGLV